MDPIEYLNKNFNSNYLYGNIIEFVEHENVNEGKAREMLSDLLDGTGLTDDELSMLAKAVCYQYEGSEA